MFDFFKDTYNEYVLGKNPDEEKKNKLLKIEEEKKKVIIIPNSIKKIIYVMGILYLIISIQSIVFSIQSKISYMALAPTIFFIILDIGSLISLSLKTRKSEIVGIVLILVFIISLFISISISGYFI